MGQDSAGSAGILPRSAVMRSPLCVVRGPRLRPGSLWLRSAALAVGARDVCVSKSESPGAFFGCRVSWVEPARGEEGSETAEILLSDVHLFLFLPSSKVPPGRNPESSSPEKVPVS